MVLIQGGLSLGLVVSVFYLKSRLPAKPAEEPVRGKPSKLD